MLARQDGEKRKSEEAGSSGDSFRCTTEQLNGALCYILSGELDLASASTLRAHLSAAAHSAGSIVFDLRNLRYLDSSGINVFLDTNAAFSRSGRRMTLVGPSPVVRRILSVLELERLIPTFDSLDEALAYLSQK
jgi:anti-anti-sigma factor